MSEKMNHGERLFIGLAALGISFCYFAMAAVTGYVASSAGLPDWLGYAWPVIFLTAYALGWLFDKIQRAAEEADLA